MRRGLAILFLFAIVSFSILWPILIGGKVFAGQMYFFDQYPRFSFIDRSQESGQSLLWSTNFLGGFPIFIGGWGENVYPLSLFLFKYFDYIISFHWLTFINFVLGGFFMYLFARNLRLSPPASVISGLVYSFSRLALNLGQFSFFSNLFPIIPLFFLAVLKLAAGARPASPNRGEQAGPSVRRAGRKKYWFLILALTTLGWLGGFTELFLYLILVGLLFAWFLNWPIIGYYIGAVVLGTVLALPRLLPTYNFIDLSARREGIFGPAFMKLGDLVEIIYPYFKVPFASFLPLDLGSSTDLYIGALPLILVAVFFVGIKEIFAKKPLAKFFAAVFAFTFLMLIEYVSPYHILNKLPVLKLFRGSGKAFPLGMFSLALMAGFGLDWLESIKGKLAFTRVIGIFKWGTVVILLLAVALNIAFFGFRDKMLNFAGGYFEENLYKQQTTGRPLEHYNQLIVRSFDRISENLSFTNFHFVFSILFLVGAFWLLNLYFRDKLSAPKFKKLAVVFVAFNFAILWQGFYALADRSVLTGIPKTAGFIKNASNGNLPYRAFRFWGGISKYVDMGWDDTNVLDRLKIETEMLSPNISILHDIDFLGGHENIMSARQAKIMALIGSERAPGQPTWISERNIPFESKLTRFQSPENRRLFSMMNVKYMLTSFELNRPAQVLQSKIWAGRSLKKVFETRVSQAQIPVFVYENPDVMPRVYFVNKPRFITDLSGQGDDQMAFDELLKINDFRQDTLIECQRPDCVYLIHKPDPADELEIGEYWQGYLKIKARVKHGRWLVFSESNLPTWEAKLTQLPTANNQLLTDSNQKAVTSNQLPVTSYQLPIYTANYLFQTVYAPAGENEIVFEYPGVWTQVRHALRNQVSKFVK